MTLLVATLSGALALAASADWKVKQLQFSALSIGVAFQDDKVGWSSFTNGGTNILLTKTVNGGTNWTEVANQTQDIMVMGLDGSKYDGLDVVSTGMLANSYSTDGDTFKASAGGPFTSQSVQASDDGRVILATETGVCLSNDGGKQYSCLKAQGLRTSGRYAAWPTKDVIYLTAGEWPSSRLNTTGPGFSQMKLSSQLRVTRRVLALGDKVGPKLAMETGPEATVSGPTNGGYVAQLLKSTDGGQTWNSVFYSNGSFYFNGIDCLDETTCVAVGEGFGKDGSSSPGARVYVTTDGETWRLTHQDVDGSSLMAAKVHSSTEHVAGGRLSSGVSVHSKDGGKTYVAEGTAIKGQMITDMNFISPTHGYATTVNNLQICSLLEFGAAA